MAKRSNFSRVPKDAYDTPKEAVDVLLGHIDRFAPWIEPAAGANALRKLRMMIVQNPLMPATVATVHPLWEPTGTVFRHWITNSLMTTFAKEPSQLECLVCCEPLHCDHGVIPDQLVVVSQSQGHNTKRNSNIRSGIICLTCTLIHSTLIHSEEELYQRALNILGLGGVQ